MSKQSKLVTISLIQTKVTKNKNLELAKTAALIEKAAKKGAQIICLEELYRTIYFPQYQAITKDEYSESIPGESTALLSKIAKKYRIVIIVPVFEKDNKGDYYNSAVVINSDGKLMDTYRKTHIPQDPYFYEKNYFQKGNIYRIYKTKYAVFAVLICYDQWFPEAAREVALQGAEIIFYPTAIGKIVGHKSQDGNWHDAWETVMRGHAIANAVHIAAVNRVGREEKLNFWGQSFVCDAFGKVLKRASAKDAEVLICKIDLSHNVRIREGWGFYRNLK
jgi:agmatine deiminase